MQLQLYNCIIYNTKYAIANVIILQPNYIFLFSPFKPSHTPISTLLQTHDLFFP